MDIHLPNKNELSLYHVFDVLLVHLTLQNYFEVSSIFCLRRVCQLTKQLIDTDAIWMHLVKTWGIPTSPWAKLAHPCLSKLALFRDYCYLERHVFVNPQRPIESRYNQAYACQVKRIGFRPNCVFIEFCVRGDMSLGTLQSPTCSRLDYVVRDNIVHRKRPDRVILLYSDERTRHEGFLFYEIEFNRLIGSELYFQYGSGGYTTELLCTINRRFCKTNRLMHLSTIRSTTNANTK